MRPRKRNAAGSATAWFGVKRSRTPHELDEQITWGRSRYLLPQLTILGLAVPHHTVLTERGKIRGGWQNNYFTVEWQLATLTRLQPADGCIDDKF
jgi:hypothetical protein